MKVNGFDGNPGAEIGTFGVQIRSGIGPLADYARAYVQSVHPEITDAIFDNELAAHFIQADLNWMQTNFNVNTVANGWCRSFYKQ